MSIRSALLRRVTVGAGCFAFGCATTVAVAWTLSLDLTKDRKPMIFARAGQTIDGRTFSVSRREGLGTVALAAAASTFEPAMQPNQIVPLEVAVPPWARSELLDWAQDDSEVRPLTSAARAVLMTGWPLSAMWTSFDQQPSPGYWWFKARNGIVTGDAPAFITEYGTLTPRERVLPTRIVWSGFLVDAVFWGTLWGAVAYGPRAVRRSVRGARGRCRGCGYDIRAMPASAACPECGASRLG